MTEIRCTPPRNSRKVVMSCMARAGGPRRGSAASPAKSGHAVASAAATTARRRRRTRPARRRRRSAGGRSRGRRPGTRAQPRAGRVGLALVPHELDDRGLEVARTRWRRPATRRRPAHPRAEEVELEHVEPNFSPRARSRREVEAQPSRRWSDTLWRSALQQSFAERTARASGVLVRHQRAQPGCRREERCATTARPGWAGARALHRPARRPRGRPSRGTRAPGHRPVQERASLSIRSRVRMPRTRSRSGKRPH